MLLNTVILAFLFMSTQFCMLPDIPGKADGGANNQVLKYEVVRNGKVIGHMESSRHDHDAVSEYHTESSVEVSIVVQLSIYTKVTGVFSHGQLVTGTALRKVNNSTRVNTKINYQKDRYVIDDEGQRTELREKINYSSACLMHVEPKGLSRIFSESYKRFIPIREVRQHYYELQLPDGNKNFYSYADGICIGAEVNTNLSKAFFRIKK